MAIEDRGFASIDEARKQQIASEGGKAAHHYGTARKWTLEEAREAGRLGKRASDEAKRRKKSTVPRKKDSDRGTEKFSKDRDATCAWDCVLPYPHNGPCSR